MKILLVSPVVGMRMSGESVKAFQYFTSLEAHGHDVVLLTHIRNAVELNGKVAADRVRYMPDTPYQRFLWRSFAFQLMLGVSFHRWVARQCRDYDPGDTVVHYLCPISPVQLRFPPKGYPVIIGTLSGNVFHPPAFRHRARLDRRIMSVLHIPTQRLFGRLFGDKKRADVVLVSGYDRTRRSLRAAGVRDQSMSDVMDSGISDEMIAHQRVPHRGENRRFVCCGRLIEFKGFDLAIRAVAASDPANRLTVIGDGVWRARLARLAESLGVADRVTFTGWLKRDALIDMLTGHRAMIFPSLAESNGIAMQEAMALGLPVVALDWGGPRMLTTSDTSILIPPSNETSVVSDIAAAMDLLAIDDARAERMSAEGQAIARKRFSWASVTSEWAAHYEHLPSVSVAKAGRAPVVIPTPPETAQAER